MTVETQSVLARVKNFIEVLLALKITEAERLRFASDPYNPFLGDTSGRKPLQVASVLSFLFHILLFLMVVPSFGDRVLIVTQEVLVLKQLAEPAALAGGGSQPEAIPPKPEPTIPEPKPNLVPIPDPTPNAPESIRKKEIEDIPRILEEIASDLALADITAPPGPPVSGSGRGQFLERVLERVMVGFTPSAVASRCRRFYSRRHRPTLMTPSKPRSRGCHSSSRYSKGRTSGQLQGVEGLSVTAWRRKPFRKLLPSGDFAREPSREDQWMFWPP